MRYEPEIDDGTRLFKPIQWGRDVFVDDHLGIGEFAETEEEEADFDEDEEESEHNEELWRNN